MAFCGMTEEAARFGATPVENTFILDTMPDLPESALRVYLYAKMLSLYPQEDASLRKLADALHMTFDAAFAAFSYLESAGLVTRLSDNPPSYCFLPAKAPVSNADEMNREFYAFSDMNARIQLIFGSEIVRPADWRTIHEFMDTFGLAQETVVRLIETEIAQSRSKKPNPGRILGRLRPKVLEYSKQGVKTIEDLEHAQEKLSGAKALAEKLAKRMSLDRSATEDEIKLVNKWLTEMEFTPDDILSACEETTKTRTPTFAYLNAILTSRRTGEEKFYEGTKEMLERLGAPSRPTSADRDTYAGFLQRGFEPETVQLAAAQCHARGWTTPEKLTFMLDQWAELGLLRQKDAQHYIDRMTALRDDLRPILHRAPGRSELERYTAWLKEWDAAVLEYALSLSAEKREPFAYAEKLLTGWRESGARDLAAAQAQTRRTSMPQTGAKNPALNYDQREYHSEDFGDNFFVDLTQYDK